MSHVLKEVATPIALFCLGLFLGWRIYRCEPQHAEPPAPAIHQTDGSTILERSPSGKPSANPDAQPLKPAGEIPKGAIVERNVQILVQPTPAPVIIPAKKPSEFDRDTYLEIPARVPLADACPPVTVDLSLIRLKDTTQRVIASSPDGKIIGGLDVPVAETPFPKVQRWTAQGVAGYDTKQGRNVFGGLVSRNLGPFTVSVGAIGGTAFVGAGIRF